MVPITVKFEPASTEAFTLHSHFRDQGWWWRWGCCFTLSTVTVPLYMLFQEFFNFVCLHKSV